MESNIIKENQLEVIQKNEIISTLEPNKLPILKSKEELLPAIIKPRELALIEIKKEFYNVKKQHSLVGVARFVKKVLIIFAKLARGTFLASTRLISFVMFSAVVILSTTIITKNVVNSLYGVKATSVDQTTYSIYSVKDDVEAKANAELNDEKNKNENDDDVSQDNIGGEVSE